MKMYKYAVTVCVCAWGAAGAADYAGPGVAGTIAEDTTWAGDVYLAGDLLIAPGATLTVEAGTRVTVAREDALSRTFVKHGANYDVEVVVAGALNVRGARDAPVIFVPEADGSPDKTWSGFELKKGGALTARDAWFVGARWPLPSAAALSDDVYTVEETRKSGSAYLPYRGRDGTGKGTYFYPDGTLIPKEVIKANRGYSRWIIAPCLTAAGSVAAFFIGMSIAFHEHGPSPSAAEAYWPLLIPPLCFGIGYLAAFGIDTRWGARRAQDKWLKERADFTPPF
jgi:hypothetical protein